MIDGITLLYSFTETTSPWTFILAWLGFLVLVGASIWLWFLVAHRSTKLHFVVAIVATVLAVITLIYACSLQPTTQLYHKVLIDESVPYREFTYFYEVVDIEGDIYTIKEIPHEIPDNVDPAPSEEPTTEPVEDPTWDTSAVG